MEIRLQAYANIRMCFQRATIEIQCYVHIIAGFHVHPDDEVFWRALNNGRQVFETKDWREIQAKLRQLNGNLSLHTSFLDSLQNFEIVFRNLLSLGAILDVFA